MSAAPKPKKPTAEEIELIKSDVTSFASSLGLCLPLSSSSGGGGFDDSDFRKSGPLKPSKHHDNQSTFDNGEKSKYSQKNSRSHPKAKAKAKPHPLQIDFHDFDEEKSNHPKLPLMKATSLSGHWYVDAEELERRLLGDEGKKLPVMRLEDLKDLAVKKKDLSERLLGQYTREYEGTRKKSGDMRLLETTARSGTSVDKISAFTCLVEDNPIASVRALDALLSMVTSKVGKRFAFNGCEALKELFVLRLLPNRKLKCLIQRPLHILPENKDGYSLLLFWYWEECLKERYERFVISLEEAVMDVLPSLKDRAMKTVYALLKSKPEQERRLLCSLVNKLGDPEKKAASNAGYQLSCLLSEHPNMKATVINEVDSFLFRPHVGLRAKYYAVNFLCQVHLSKRGDGSKVAKRLVEIYFALFKVLIFESGNGNMPDNKTSVEGTEKSGRKGRNFKRKPVSSLGSNKKKAFQETTHVEMDSRLLSALLTGVNRAFPFVSSEEADDILEVQTPILYKLAHSENFNVGVQALMLLYQISAKNQIASDRFYRALYAKLLTPAAVSYSKPEMFLGLLVKAMKNDLNMKRVSAFSKRLMQVALQRPPQYACGCLFLLSEVLKAKPSLWRVILQDSIDDELEHFEDIIEEEQIIPPAKNATLECSGTQNGKWSQQDSDSDKENNINNGPNTRSANDFAAVEAQSHHKGSSLPGGYDPRHREPVYCNADRIGLWELTILASHVHPSVAAMAKALLFGENIVYNGDPLNDLSLGAFLDKLMEKKPRPNKKAEGIWHGGSQIAPAKKLDTGHHLIGEEILQLAEEEVPPEDVVFHRFYMNKTSSSKKLMKKKKVASADDENVGADLLFDENGEDGEEEDEEEIDNILGAGPLPLGEDEGEFDYGDLSRVIEEDDEDLLGHGSDAEDEQASDAATDDDVEEEEEEEEEEKGDDGDIEIWGADTSGDGDNENKNPTYNGRKKIKSAKKNRPSPFASLEDYEHLMAEDRSEKMAENSGKEYKSKLEKKRKHRRYV